MTQDIRDTINRLLKYADPEGEVHDELVSMSETVERGVMLGPKSRRMLMKLTEMVDNIECRHLQYDGMCPKVRKRCPFTKDYARCNMFEVLPPPKPGTNPIAPGGK
jgi:hypothetical protein